VWVSADSPNRVALVVKHGDGDVITQCIEFNGDQISGYEVLKRSNLDLNFEPNAMGAAICRIDGEGCSYPQDDCFCQCNDLTGQTPCIYWSYWYRDGGDWRYSGFGASSRDARNGDVEGWVWSEGSVSSADTEPPDLEFSDICAELPTATPTPTNTPKPTPTLTNTPQPTETPEPEPTDTPSPKPTPVIHSFSASQSQIKAGQQATLSWSLDGATAAFIEINGVEEAVVAPGSKTVTPNQTTRYRLVARNGDQSQAVAELVITVDGVAAATPVPTPTDAGQLAQPVSAVAAAPTPISPSPSPAATTTGLEPVVSFGAASLILPQGACTTLTWRVDHADAIYLDGQPAAAEDDREVCPAGSRTYVLRAESAAGTQESSLSLQVTEPVVVASEQDPESSPELAELPTVAVETTGATPAAVAARKVPLAGDSRTDEEVVRRFTVTSNEAEVDSGPNQLLVAGGITLVVVLFIVVPLTMLLIGGAVWWLRRQA
jgi:hypothetical protein